MKISGSGKRISLTVNGTRCGIRVDCGPWIKPEMAGMIKLRPKNGVFPECVSAVLSVQNHSDSREDYFVSDEICLFPGHALYEAAKAAVA